MKAFIQLTNNRSCLLRADEIKADYERGHITVSDGGRIQGVFDMGVLEYVYMTEPRKENKAMKCKTCEVMKRIEASNEPACCMWYMDNVVCGDKSVKDCTVYEPPKGE